MSEPSTCSENNEPESAPPVPLESDHSDGDSDVMADWALVNQDGELQESGDESSSTSGSSIEVMSLEDEDTDLDLQSSTSSMTPLTAEARRPMFILRVPSTEAALKALGTESEESDESEQSEDQQPYTKADLKTDMSHSLSDISQGNNDVGKEKGTKGDNSAVCRDDSMDPITSSGNLHDGTDVAVREITCRLEEVPLQSENMKHGEESIDDTDEVKAECQSEEKGENNISKLPVFSFNTVDSTLLSDVSPQPCEKVDKVVDFSLISKTELSNPDHQRNPADPSLNPVGPSVNPEDNQLRPLPEHDNDNVINEILDEKSREKEGLPDREEEENNYNMEENGQDDVDLNFEQQIPELGQERENDLDPIIINDHGIHLGDQRYYFDVEQDDPETESSTENDIHDDRIESDQSDLQTTDNSNLSNVDISDLMENIHVNRQYLHHPRPWIDVFLNATVVLVISVAIGMGIGHNLGSAPSLEIHYPKTIQCHKNVDDFIQYTILDQKLDRCERKLVTREETLVQRYKKIFAENIKLKNEANMLKNEVYDLRSEVIRLKYKRSQEVGLSDSDQKRRESVTSVLVRANHLEQENSDLRFEIGRLKYGHHANQRSDIQKDPNMLEMKEKQEEKRDTDELLKRVTSLKNELSIERERSETWKNLYKEKVEELKSSKQEEENSTKDVYGCMKLILKNLSLPLNISKKIEERWKTLQNVSLTGFVEVLRSFVHSEKQENRQDWSSGTKNGHAKWSDTVNKVLNKTKASMSDVSQQIQDTWKQVKNLSHDLWKTHEPVVTEHLKKVQESMQEATEQLKNSFKNSKWFGKRGQKKKRHGNRQDSEHSSKNKNSFKKSTFKSYTKRRGHEGKSRDGVNEKHHKHRGKNNKKVNKQIQKLYNKMQNLNVKKFEKFGCKKRRKILKVLGYFTSDPKVNKIQMDRKAWLDCQYSWWLDIVNGVPSGQAQCVGHLFNWQRSLVNDCPHCRKNCQKSKGKNKHNGKGRRHKKHQHDQRKQQHQEKKNPRHDRKHDDEWNKNQDFDGHKENKHFYKDHTNKNEESLNNQQTYQNDLPGLVFDDPTMYDDFNKHNTSDGENLENDGGCSPDSDACDGAEKNWYLRQMEQRKNERNHPDDDDWYIRQMKQRQNERRHYGDDHDKKSDWMFKRAEDREFERRKPDNWFFRRSDEWVEHGEAPPKPEKQFMKQDNFDHDYYDQFHDYEDEDYFRCGHCYYNQFHDYRNEDNFRCRHGDF